MKAKYELLNKLFQKVDFCDFLNVTPRAEFFEHVHIATNEYTTEWKPNTHPLSPHLLHKFYPMCITKLIVDKNEKKNSNVNLRNITKQN